LKKSPFWARVSFAMIQILKTRLIEKNKLTSDVFEFIFEILDGSEQELSDNSATILKLLFLHLY
jgi:hypothetical protein